MTTKRVTETYTAQTVQQSVGQLNSRATELIDQTLTLDDGRKLGYAEFGDLKGFPIVYFHGYPASRLEGWVLHGVARKRGLRIIAPDRPGHGLSTIQPGRYMKQWPQDVHALTSYLKLERFAVLGASAGGPYALACAQYLPRKLLNAVGIMSGAGPWEGDPSAISRPRRILSWLAWNMPTALRIVTNITVGFLRWMSTTKFVTRRIDAYLEKESKSELEPQETVAERRKWLLKLGFDGFAQGAASALEETKLLSPDWHLNYSEITYDPIQIWHGSADQESPISLTRYLAKQLPHAELHELEGQTHGGVFTKLEEILEELVPNEMGPKSTNS